MKTKYEKAQKRAKKYLERKTRNDSIPPGFWIGLVLIAILLIIRNCLIR